MRSVTYFVQINQQSDGSLPPDQWVKVVAGNMTEGIAEVLRHGPDHNQPTMAFVALNKHENGEPFICQGFALSWGEKRSAV